MILAPVYPQFAPARAERLLFDNINAPWQIVPRLTSIRLCAAQGELQCSKRALKRWVPVEAWVPKGRTPHGIHRSFGRDGYRLLIIRSGPGCSVGACLCGGQVIRHFWGPSGAMSSRTSWGPDCRALNAGELHCRCLRQFTLVEICLGALTVNPASGLGTAGQALQ